MDAYVEDMNKAISIEDRGKAKEVLLGLLEKSDSLEDSLSLLTAFLTSNENFCKKILPDLIKEIRSRTNAAYQYKKLRYALNNLEEFSREQLLITVHLGIHYKQTGQLQKSRTQFEKANDLITTAGETDKIEFYREYSDLNYQRGFYKKSHAMALKSLKLAENLSKEGIKADEILGNAYLYMGDLLKRCNKYKDCKIWLEKLIDFTENKEHLSELKKSSIKELQQIKKLSESSAKIIYLQNQKIKTPKGKSSITKGRFSTPNFRTKINQEDTMKRTIDLKQHSFLHDIPKRVLEYNRSLKKDFEEKLNKFLPYLHKEKTLKANDESPVFKRQGSSMLMKSIKSSRKSLNKKESSDKIEKKNGIRPFEIIKDHLLSIDLFDIGSVQGKLQVFIEDSDRIFIVFSTQLKNYTLTYEYSTRFPLLFYIENAILPFLKIKHERLHLKKPVFSGRSPISGQSMETTIYKFKRKNYLKILAISEDLKAFKLILSDWKLDSLDSITNNLELKNSNLTINDRFYRGDGKEDVEESHLGQEVLEVIGAKNEDELEILNISDNDIKVDKLSDKGGSKQSQISGNSSQNSNFSRSEERKTPLENPEIPILDKNVQEGSKKSVNSAISSQNSKSYRSEEKKTPLENQEIPVLDKNVQDVLMSNQDFHSQQNKDLSLPSSQNPVKSQTSLKTFAQMVAKRGFLVEIDQETVLESTEIKFDEVLYCLYLVNTGHERYLKIKNTKDKIQERVLVKPEYSIQDLCIGLVRDKSYFKVDYSLLHKLKDFVQSFGNSKLRFKRNQVINGTVHCLAAYSSDHALVFQTTGSSSKPTYLAIKKSDKIDLYKITRFLIIENQLIAAMNLSENENVYFLLMKDHFVEICESMNTYTLKACHKDRMTTAKASFTNQSIGSLLRTLDLITREDGESYFII